MHVSDTNLGDGDLDAFTEEEADSLLRWYSETHGEGDLSLAGHVPFLIENDAGSFKRQRRYMQLNRDDENGLPLFVVGLMFLYGYLILRDERGIYYEVIASREWGAHKAEILATVRAAYPIAGPIAVNLLADRAGEYLAAWTDEGEPDPGRWPRGWGGPRSEHSPHPEPHYARFLGRYRPQVAAAMRERLEFAVRGSVLPAQMFPLFRLFTATLTCHPRAARNAAADSRRVGVRRDHALEAFCWALGYADEHAVSELTMAIEPEMNGWEP